MAEKKRVAPETRRIRWLEFPEAVGMTLASMVGPPLVTVDDWSACGV